jgi:DNA-binding beta-propeller fold protein YncE
LWNIGNISGTLTTPSSVKVIDLKTGHTKASISTGGQARADDLCYNPNSNVVLVANSNTMDNFITFIDEDSYQILGQISFAGSDPNSGPFATGLKADCIEQCVFNPRDGKFYINIAAVAPIPPSTNTQGYTLRISAAAPFTVEAAFQIPKTSGCTGGSGLAVGPAHQLALACGRPSANSLIISDLFDGTAIPAGPGGVDEAWYNPGTNHYYYGPLGTPLLGVVDAGSTTNDPSIPTVGAFAHSVAADSVSNQVYVPTRSSFFGPATVCHSSPSVLFTR